MKDQCFIVDEKEKQLNEQIGKLTYTPMEPIIVPIVEDDLHPKLKEGNLVIKNQ